MQSDTVAEFSAALGQAMNAARGAKTADRARMEKERAQIARKLEAIAEGLRTPGLKGKLEDLEARLASIEEELAAPAPSPVRLHPNLSALYRQKVTELAVTLALPEIRTAALETVHSLIERVTVHETEGAVRIELEGAITAMIGLAQPGAAGALDHGSLGMVAGVGFEPTTFRL